MLPDDQVDQRIECAPPEQCGCGSQVLADADKPIIHQVFDLPVIEPVITTYVRLRGVCSGCGRKHHGELPSGVPQGQLGARALALLGTLSGEFHLSMRKVQSVLSHVMGMHFSLGTISAAHGTVAHALAAPVQQLHAQLQHAPVCHADETRHQSHSQTLWTWVQTSDWGASFKIDPSRGQAAAKQVLGESPSFVLVSDRYAAYNFVPMQQRQVCWAHLLRDFERIAQRSGSAGRIGERLLDCGCLLFRWREQGKAPAYFERLQRLMRSVLERGVAQTRCTRTANTCNNLLKCWPALWTFLDNPLVTPTNNAAERALRGYVLKRKISYCTRSKQGLDFSERIFSTVQTCKMQGRVAYSFITNAVQSWLGKSPFPSLVPEHIHLHHACA